MKTVLIVIVLFAARGLPAQVMFQRTFPDALGHVHSAALVQASDGGYVITGTSPGLSGADAHLFKTDPNGNLSWWKTMRRSGWGAGTSICKADDGGYMLTGDIYVDGHYTDVWLCKTDSFGNVAWSKAIGGTLEDYGWSVQPTYDNGFVVAGTRDNFGIWYAYLFKADSAGSVVWSRGYSAWTSDEFNMVTETSDHGFICVGSTNQFGGYDIYVVKTDSVGTLLWSKIYGASGANHGLAIRQTSDGGYAIVGYGSDFGAGQEDIYLLKTDGSGNLQWCKAYGSSEREFGWDMRQTDDDGYIIFADGGSATAGYNAITVRTDASGNLLWSKTYGGAGEELAYAGIITADSGFALTGSARSFGTGEDESYLIKTDRHGVSGCHEASGTLIVTVIDTMVVSQGTFTTTLVAFSDTAGVDGGPPATQRDLCFTGISDSKEVPTGLSIYPNPSSGLLRIKVPAEADELPALTMTNSIGAMVKSCILNGGDGWIDCSGLRGVYFVEVRSGVRRFCGKVVID